MIRSLFFTLTFLSLTLSLDANALSSINVKSGDSSISFDGSDFVYDGTSYSTIAIVSNSNDSTATIHTSGDMTFANALNMININSSNIGVVNANNITIEVSELDSFVKNSSTATNSTFINSGDIKLSGSGSFAGNGGAVTNMGTFSSITNSGTIEGRIFNNTGASIGTLSNSGTISSSSDSAITNSAGTITTITNSSGGTISSSGSGSSAIYNGGTISTITNSSGANITSSQSYGIDNQSSIGTLNNYGTITSDLANINNALTITTLNNSQGGNSNALTFSGTLPENYNILINSSSSYGQLSASGISGSTSFGISSLSSITQRSYSSVLQGLTSSNITSTSGSYDGMTWNLALESGSSTNWDLSFSGVPTTQTQKSIANLSSNLKGNFMSQTFATNFANMNTYDCDLFDKKGICVSVGGQANRSRSPNLEQGNSVLVAGYKISPHVRVGGFVNQGLTQNASNNFDSVVKTSNTTPLVGLFAVWNQQQDTLGYQIKIANAYQNQSLRTTRQVFDLSEAGIGKTNLITQSYVGEFSYASLLGNTTIRPYFALRYTNIAQDNYVEENSVASPLSYSAVNNRSFTSLFGAKFNHPLTKKLNLTGSLGLEKDLYYSAGSLTATGLSGLSSENFSSKINHNRAVAGVGSYFNLNNNQRVAGEVFYQQLPFQKNSATTLYISYLAGF